MPDAAPGPSPRARTAIRLIVSPILLGTLLGVLWLQDSTGSPLPTDLLLLLAGAVGAWELAALFKGASRPVVPWVAAVASGLIAGVGLFAPGVEDAASRMELRVVFVTAAFLVLLLQHLRDTRPEAVERIAFTLIPIMFVGLLLSYVREVGVGPEAARIFAWVTVTAKASDMAGWIVGKPFGKHKMIPSVSPGKSWEGCIAGLVASAAVAVWLPGLLGLSHQAWSVGRLALFGLALGAASILAGVTWSGWKRRLGAKDSSPLIPEVGGVLDMIDSMLLAGPVAWAWFQLGL